MSHQNKAIFYAIQKLILVGTYLIYFDYYSADVLQIICMKLSNFEWQAPSYLKFKFKVPQQ